MRRASWVILGFTLGALTGAAATFGILGWAGLLVLRSGGVQSHWVTPALTRGQFNRLASALDSKTPLPSGAVLAPDPVGPFRRSHSPPPKLPVRIEVDDTTATYEAEKGSVRFYYEATADWPAANPCNILHQRVRFEDQRHQDYWESDRYNFTRIELKGSDLAVWAWNNGDNIFVLTSTDDGLAEAFIEEYPY